MKRSTPGIALGKRTGEWRVLTAAQYLELDRASRDERWEFFALRADPATGALDGDHLWEMGVNVWDAAAELERLEEERRVADSDSEDGEERGEEESVPYTFSTPPLDPRRYLARERRATQKHEYHDGELVSMAGASRAHGRIVANLTRGLGAQLGDGPCEYFIADQRVRLAQANFFVYPDIAVVCGPARFTHRDNLTNPLVVFEVLSPSTERHDRGRKAEGYRAVPTLQAYVLVAQNEPRVEIYRRGDGGPWECTLLQRLEDEFTLEPIGCTFRLADVYRRVFPPAGDEAAAPPPPLEYRLKRR